MGLFRFVVWDRLELQGQCYEWRLGLVLVVILTPSGSYA